MWLCLFLQTPQESGGIKETIDKVRPRGCAVLCDFDWRAILRISPGPPQPSFSIASASSAHHNPLILDLFRHAAPFSCTHPPQILIADFFVVLAVLAWLAAGVLQSVVQGGSSPLLDAWYPLWPLLWQPAIGILMAGALVSGGLGWIREQQEKR